MYLQLPLIWRIAPVLNSKRHSVQCMYHIVPTRILTNCSMFSRDLASSFSLNLYSQKRSYVAL